MARATLTRSKRSQTIRLPEDVAFPDHVREVRIQREGSRIVVAPVDASWDNFFDSPGADLPEREPPLAPARQEF
ncbi:MAG: type II toxin-antitoxin system VapB family antitoxin [Beijerinckiaceae bacterium]